MKPKADQHDERNQPQRKDAGRVDHSRAESADQVHPTIRKDKVTEARRAIREGRYGSESVVEQTAKRIVDLLTGRTTPPDSGGK